MNRAFVAALLTFLGFTGCDQSSSDHISVRASHLFADDFWFDRSRISNVTVRSLNGKATAFQTPDELKSLHRYLFENAVNTLQSEPEWADWGEMVVEAGSQNISVQVDSSQPAKYIGVVIPVPSGKGAVFSYVADPEDRFKQ